MHYDLLTPCGNCPFLRKGGIRLHKARVREIAGMLLSSQGGTFPCHKTTVESEDEDGESDRRATKDSQHCAGALIFTEKVNPAGTQMMRIAERLGMYDAAKLMSNKQVVDTVFNDVNEMLKAK